MGAPPIAQASAGGGSGAVNTTMNDALGGGMMAPGQAQADAAEGLNRLMERIRAIDSEVQGLAADMPELAPNVEQLRNLLKQMVVASAKAAPQQTPSGAALPV